jgi:hypothetical protein
MMATAKRKRPETIKIMATWSEKQELLRAAKKADVPLAVVMRTLTLAAVRRGETVIAAQAADIYPPPCSDPPYSNW